MSTPALQFTSGFDPCYSHVRANHWDWCIGQEIDLWTRIQCEGGITEFCRRGEAPRYEVPPWVTMPPQGRRYQEINTIVVGPILPNVGVDVPVVSFRVPLGYDGVITTFVNRFLGIGFIEGSGDLTWRIRLNLRFVKDYGAITTSLGDLTSPVSLQGGRIRLVSGQLVQYLVNPGALAAAHLDPNGRILCALSGWFFPRP